MTTPTLASICAQELTNAYNPELLANQQAALSAYNALPGPVVKGWSNLTSSDVRDAIEGCVAEIMGSIGDEPLCWFAPNDETDTDQAEAESHLVHQQIMSANRGRLVLEATLRDALLQRFGICKVWIDERIDVKTKTFEGVIPDAIAALVTSAEPPSTIEVLDSTLNSDGTLDVRLRITNISRKLKVESIAPEDFVWSNDLTSSWLDDARFLAERAWYTRSQLKTLGVADELADHVNSTAYTDAAALQRRGQSMNASMAPRKEDQLIECWWCWLRTEDEGRQRVLFAMPNTVLLDPEDMPFHPYVGGVAIMAPHRFDGVSLYDRLAGTQEAKTTLLRLLATQARLSCQIRIGVRERGANPDDLTTDALNPFIRCIGNPAETLLPLPIQDTTSQLLSTMQWLDGVRRDQGGAAVDMASPEMQVGQQSAHAAERDYSYRELQSEQLLRTFGETMIRGMALLVHHTLKMYSPGVLSTRIDKSWIRQDPQHWPERMETVLELGATLGTRTRRLRDLQNLSQSQAMAFQNGGSGIIVTPDNLYRAELAKLRAANIHEPEQYWMDPSTPEAIAQRKKQEQQQLQQEQQMREQAEQAQRIQVELQAKMLQIEAEKNTTNATLKSQELRLEALNNKQMLQEKYYADLLGLVEAKMKSEESDNADTDTDTDTDTAALGQQAVRLSAS